MRECRAQTILLAAACTLLGWLQHGSRPLKRHCAATGRQGSYTSTWKKALNSLHFSSTKFHMLGIYSSLFTGHRQLLLLGGSPVLGHRSKRPVLPSAIPPTQALARPASASSGLAQLVRTDGRRRQVAGVGIFENFGYASGLVVGCCPSFCSTG